MENRLPSAPFGNDDEGSEKAHMLQFVQHCVHIISTIISVSEGLCVKHFNCKPGFLQVKSTFNSLKTTNPFNYQSSRAVRAIIFPTLVQVKCMLFHFTAK